MENIQSILIKENLNIMTETKTQQFLASVENPLIDKLFNPIINILTKDRYLNLLYNYKTSRMQKIPKKLLDIITAKIERKLGITEETRYCLFGRKGSIGKRSSLAHLINPVISKYLDGWKKRQENKIQLPREIHKAGEIRNIWKGWKKLRDEVCPNFKVTFNPKKDKTIMIMPHDTMLPRDRINRLVEFKDVDRVGIGFAVSHAASVMGAQPSHKIGGLWQYTYGPGINMAKATINTWIRLGGLDFFPTSMIPTAMPLPETHSPFYFDWKPPSDNIYEQFIEKELIKTYDQIYDWGLSSIAQEVSKWVVRQAFVGVREFIKSFMGINKYFGKSFMRSFADYTLSIFALWDVIPMARSMIPFMKDLRKKPEEIIEVFQFLEPGLTEIGLAIAKIARAKYVLIGNSRGSSSWVSPKMFEEVFWPTQKATCEKIIKAGFKLCAHLDNDWTENMHYMLELPKHSGFFHLDQSNLPKVREIIGDHFCLMGNLQPSITCGSGPDRVYKETKKLIETCGQDGGYIVATGCEAPAIIPIENYYAVKRAIIDHGYYKK